MNSFSLTVAGTNVLRLIHASDHMLVTYIENYDGEKITRITKGAGMYCSLSNTKQMCSYDGYFYSKERGKQIPYIRASLLAQMVMNLPAMRDTWVRSLGWEYHLEEGMAIYSCVEDPHGQGAWHARKFQVISTLHSFHEGS